MKDTEPIKDLSLLKTNEENREQQISESLKRISERIKAKLDEDPDFFKNLLLKPTNT